MRTAIGPVAAAILAASLQSAAISAQEPPNLGSGKPAAGPALGIDASEYEQQYLQDVEPESYREPDAAAGSADEFEEFDEFRSASPVSECLDCNGRAGAVSRYPYDRCGCNLGKFPWIRGTGNCDDWCVGPHWQVQVGGLILNRDSVDWAPVIAAVGSAPNLVDPFDEAPGARIAVTGYNDRGYGMQVVYEGANDFTAATLFPLAGATRAIDYESRLNSVEINLLPRVEGRWSLLGGFRYVELGENFIDFTTVDKVIPTPADPPAAPGAFVDLGTDYLIKNRLMGFQVGAFRDAWTINRWLSLEGFANAGVYLNDIRREQIDRNVTTVIYGDDLATPDVDEFVQDVTTVNTIETRSFSEAAFVGEAGLTAVLRPHPCFSVRSGYQILAMDGVAQGVDAFFEPGVSLDTVVFHGLQVGFEYRR